MKIVDNIANWWHSINRRRRVSVLNSSSGKEWSTHISPLRGLLVVMASVFTLFIAIIVLVGHTSILNILPHYRTLADRSREQMVSAIIKIDSMERVMTQMIVYNENVGLILEGKTPVVRSTLESEPIIGRTFTQPNTIDSVLRAQMEGESAYNLNNAIAEINRSRNPVTFSAPIEGIITERFNMRDGQYGVRIAALPESRIVAAGDGVVVHSLWSPEGSNIVELLHSDNTITIYRNMSQALVERGESVGRGQIIGYNGVVVDNSSQQLFEFEVWSDGKPTDPEQYILF